MSAGFVYIFRRADGLRKLGWTVEPKRRVRELTNETGVRHERERTWQMGDIAARKVESVAHRALRKLRVKGKREVYKAALAAMRRTVVAAMDEVNADIGLSAASPPKPRFPPPDWQRTVREFEEYVAAHPDEFEAMLEQLDAVAQQQEGVHFGQAEEASA